MASQSDSLNGPWVDLSSSLILVEALASLSAVLAFGHQLGQERAGPEQGLVRVLLGPALDDEMGRVESDIISEFWK